MRLPQVSFGAGELSPALWDRSDFGKTQVGARTLRNCVVKTEGGFQNRNGTIMLAEVPADGVLIPFKYSATEEYTLVFTDQQMRVIRNNGLVLRSLRSAIYAWTASGSGTNEYYLRLLAGTDPGLVQPGAAEVYINSAVATQGTAGALAAGRWGWGDNDTLGYSTVYVRLADGTDPDGKAADYIQCVSVTAHPFLAAHLNDLSFTQSFDTVFLSHASYASYNLTRTDHPIWTFAVVPFVPSLSAPAGVAVTPAAPADVNYEYFISSMDSARAMNPAMKSVSGNKSPYQAADDATVASSKVTVATPSPWDGTVSISCDAVTGAVYYALWRKLSTATYWSLRNVSRTPSFIDTNKGGKGSVKYSVRSATSVPTGTNGTHEADTTTIRQFEYAVSAQAVDESYPSAAVASSKKTPWKAGTSVSVTWNAVAGSEIYNVYKNARGTWGWIGSTNVADTRQFLDDNINPDVGYAPRGAPVYDLSTNKPGCCALFQQRLIFSGVTTDPARVLTSRLGSYLDFSLSDPLRADDPVDARPASGRGDATMHLVPFDTLLVFTTDAVWSMNGTSGALRADDVSFKVQSYYGAAKAPAPLVTGTAALFVQRGGNVIRDLAYTFSSDKYEGNDLTVFSRHLFDGETIRRWAFESEPASIVWTVKDDGGLLAMTYMKEQDLRAWTRHDTDGLFRSVCSNNQGTYFLVSRVIGGVTKYYVERLATDAEAVFTDSSLIYSGAGTTTLSGLSHLEGKVVQYRGVGSSFNGYGAAVVTGGAITVPSVTSAAVGLPVVAEFLSLDVNRPGDDAKRRLASSVTLRLRDTRGLAAGADEDGRVLDLPLSDAGDANYDATTKLYTGDIVVPIDARWKRNPTVYLRQSQPYRFHIVAMIPEEIVGEP
jgi:hypothetical protein